MVTILTSKGGLYCWGNNLHYELSPFAFEKLPQMSKFGHFSESKQSLDHSRQASNRLKVLDSDIQQDKINPKTKISYVESVPSCHITFLLINHQIYVTGNHISHLVPIPAGVDSKNINVTQPMKIEFNSPKGKANNSQIALGQLMLSKSSSLGLSQFKQTVHNTSAATLGLKSINEKTMTSGNLSSNQPIAHPSTGFAAVMNVVPPYKYGEQELGISSTVPEQQILISGISCSPSHVIAWTVQGSAYAWGINKHGCIGIENNRVKNFDKITKPERVDIMKGSKLIQCVALEEVSFGITHQGKLFTWGK